MFLGRKKDRKRGREGRREKRKSERETEKKKDRKTKRQREGESCTNPTPRLSASQKEDEPDDAQVPSRGKSDKKLEQEVS